MKLNRYIGTFRFIIRQRFLKQVFGRQGKRFRHTEPNVAWDALIAQMRPKAEDGGLHGIGSRGALLWLLGVPLPIIILVALFWHH